jgi:HAD superfamily hydrolase (TIGR01490 family)
MPNILALFDFDGTISKKDSFIEFIKYYKGFHSFCFGFILLSPILLLYKIRLIKNWRAKKIVFSWFFKNESYKVFKSKCKCFSLTIIPQLIKPIALETIKKHIENGDKVIIISASFEDYLADWCKSMNLELLGTKIDFNKGFITGKIDGKNCYGDEKVIRLNQFLDLSLFNEIYAYGDSKSDLPLLEIANHRFYKFFR